MSSKNFKRIIRTISIIICVFSFCSLEKTENLLDFVLGIEGYFFAVIISFLPTIFSWFILEAIGYIMKKAEDIEVKLENFEKERKEEKRNKLMNSI